MSQDKRRDDSLLGLAKASGGFHTGKEGRCGESRHDTTPSFDEPGNTRMKDLRNDELHCLEPCCGSITNEPLESTSACSEHLQAAFERFEALLRRGQCLCRKMIAEFNFCCCCGTYEDGRSKRAASEQPASKRCDSPKKCAGDQCCSGGANEAKGHTSADTLAACDPAGTDIEHAAAREHVVINVTGMTCTGCSRKMQNVLNDIAGVSNPEVTFVSGTAKFELDAALASLDEVLPLIERRTGFKLSRVFKDDHQQLDVLLDEGAAAKFEQRALNGVLSFEKACSHSRAARRRLAFTDSPQKLKAKRTYRITYDPHLIGARSLLPAEGELAPPGRNSSQTEGRQRLFEMAWATAVSAALTIPVVVLAWSDTPVSGRTRDSVSLALATLVQGIAVPEFYVGAIKPLIFSKVIEMDMLVVISITAAYFYSVIAFGLAESGVKLVQEAFFETSTLLITLVLLGRLVAALARMRAISAVSLQSLQAQAALIIHADHSTSQIDARLLQFGDSIRVPPHGQVVS